MRSHALAFLAGMLTTLVLLLYCGGEVITQLGLRMTAASTSYDFQAVPHAVVLTVAHTRR